MCAQNSSRQPSTSLTGMKPRRIRSGHGGYPQRSRATLERRADSWRLMAGHRCGPAPLAPRHAPRLQASAHIGSNRAPTPAQPALLDAWEQLADGRYAGNAEGRPVWLTVSLEVRDRVRVRLRVRVS